MSKFLNLSEIPITDQSILVDTLRESMKFRGAANQADVVVESHDTPQGLFGHHGDARPESAEVIVRRNIVGQACNDIGFVRTASGNFRPIISQFDNSVGYNQKWLNTLAQNYGVKKFTKTMLDSGYAVDTQQTLPTGEISLTFRQFGG